MPTPREVAAQFIARCRAGFANEFQHANWLKKHAQEIAALPMDERDRVLFEHEQATAREFSVRK